jgi:hypothetical protein
MRSTGVGHGGGYVQTRRHIGESLKLLSHGLYSELANIAIVIFLSRFGDIMPILIFFHLFCQFIFSFSSPVSSCLPFLFLYQTEKL